jgi:hypothetical protein
MSLGGQAPESCRPVIEADAQQAPEKLLTELMGEIRRVPMDASARLNFQFRYFRSAETYQDLESLRKSCPAAITCILKPIRKSTTVAMDHCTMRTRVPWTGTIQSQSRACVERVQRHMGLFPSNCDSPNAKQWKRHWPYTTVSKTAFGRNLEQ